MNFKILAAITVLIWPMLGQAHNSEFVIEPAEGWVQERQGYVDDARRESPDVGQPLELLAVPEFIQNRTTFRDELFNSTMTKEFKSRYEDKFGRTEAERVYRDQNKFGTYESSTGEWVNPYEQNEEQAEFANYMSKRLLEYHLENYSKTQPRLREAYALKEKVTNYEVSVAPGYTVKSHYSISGNYFDVNLGNPYVGTRARVEMNPDTFGPSDVVETRVALDRRVTSSVGLEANILIEDGIASLITRKSLSGAADVSLMGSTYFKTSGRSVRENLGLLGYNLRF